MNRKPLAPNQAEQFSALKKRRSLKFNSISKKALKRFSNNFANIWIEISFQSKAYLSVTK